MFEFRWAQCRRVQPALWDYASERLSEEMMERVERHLQSCAGCNREMASLKRAQGLLAACRAQEEPAPRSDWSNLQQRIVADGLTHIATPSSRRLSTSLRRSRSGAEGRPSWTMQLAGSTVGSFAAVLIVAVGYQALHLHTTPSLTHPTKPETAALSPVAAAPATPKTSAQDMSFAPNTVLNAQMAESIAQAVRQSQQNNNPAVSRSVPAKVTRTNKSEYASTGASLLPAVSHANANEKWKEHKQDSRAARVAAYTQTRSAFTSRAPRYKTLVSTLNTPKLQTYHTNAKSRAASSPPIQIASRYALEHVQPIGTDSDDSDVYVVGSVRPIARDDDGVY